jgi:hypothetical protein
LTFLRVFAFPSSFSLLIIPASFFSLTVADVLAAAGFAASVVVVFVHVCTACCGHEYALHVHIWLLLVLNVLCGVAKA